MMLSTPPRRVQRAHTPPAPRHGAKDDDYEPYSPRRSTRSTLSRNPYSSFNSDRSTDRKKDASRERTPVRPRGGYTTPPPTTARKRARFAQSISQLSSPPTSPTLLSPSVKTPQRRRSARISISPAGRDGTSSFEQLNSPTRHSTSLLATATIDPTFSLLTPSKTPTRRTNANSSQKRSFSTFVQPASPSHVMPPSRKIKRFAAPAGFDLDGSPSASYSTRHVSVYTDPQSRVAELDTSESNPFVTTQDSADIDMPNAAHQNLSDNRFTEGVLYVKRGKKIFRPFAGSTTTHINSAEVEIGAPLRSNSDIRPIDLLRTRYRSRTDDAAAPTSDQTAEPSVSSTDSRTEYSASNALRLMHDDASDSEASTLSGGEMSPTIAFSTYKRRGRKANVSTSRASRPLRSSTRIRPAPLDDPFAGR